MRAEVEEKLRERNRARGCSSPPAWLEVSGVKPSAIPMVGIEMERGFGARRRLGV